MLEEVGHRGEGLGARDSSSADLQRDLGVAGDNNGWGIRMSKVDCTGGLEGRPASRSGNGFWDGAVVFGFVEDFLGDGDGELGWERGRGRRVDVFVGFFLEE